MCCCITTWAMSTATIGAWGFARGGMGAISNALGMSFEEAGGEIRKGAGIERFKVTAGKVTGVALENGDEFDAPIVASNMDVKRTFLHHVDRAELPDDFHRAVERFKIRGSSAKINIALDALPDISGGPCRCVLPARRHALLDLAGRARTRLR